MGSVRPHKLVSSVRTNIGSIDQDLLIEVLCCLPPKILMRCSCVCKPWYALIHLYCVPRITPSLPFLGCHVIPWVKVPKRVPKRDFVIGRAAISDAGPDVDAWPPVFNDPIGGGGHNGFSVDFIPSAKYLLDSRDGLMLFRHPSENNYVLWNPTTKRFLLIPCPDESGIFTVLVIDIRHWKADRGKDFFKIISFSGNKEVLDVFSSRDSAWHNRKVLNSSPLADKSTFTLDKRYVYLQGKVFILCHPDLVLWFAIGEGNVDVVFNFVSLPDDDLDASKKGRPGFIGSCGGRFQYAQFDHTARFLIIWVLSVDDRKWTRLYRLSFKALSKHPQYLYLRSMFPPIRIRFNALTFDPASDDGIIVWTYNFIFCYYYKSGILVHLPCSNVLINDELRHNVEYALPFTQCLASLALAR